MKVYLLTYRRTEGEHSIWGVGGVFSTVDLASQAASKLMKKDSTVFETLVEEMELDA